jgi:hypothetical protein
MLGLRVGLAAAAGVIAASTTGCALWDAGDSNRESPLSYSTAGGPETGITFEVPADWVGVEPESADLRDRGGIAFLDPRGADIAQLWQAHLLASCADTPLQTTAQLELAIKQGRADSIDPVVEVIRPGGRDVVRSEFNLETAEGEIEHWFAYNMLAEPGRICTISLVTPLEGGDRAWLTEIFEHIGETIDPAGDR